MVIFAADDEAPARRLLVSAIKAAIPDAQVRDFSLGEQLLECAKEEICSIAFLDIEMRDMTGIELAKRLKEIQPRANIVFVTGFGEYKGEAMDMHASGYVTKPVSAEKITNELKYLRNPIDENEKGETESKKLVKVNCFGNFEVYTFEGKPLHFERSKAKELMAYLVFKNGASCSIREIHAALFEDAPFDKRSANYIRQIIASLGKSLSAAGAADVIIRGNDSYSIVKDMIDCDYYRFLNNDKNAEVNYTGEFMNQYSWCEYVTGYLDNRIFGN